VRVVLSGSGGLIGGALAPALSGAGHEVVRLVRSEARPGAARWDPAAGVLDERDLHGADAVVHLAGAGIGDRRWTAARRTEILDSRVRGTELLARTVAGMRRPPAVLVSASAVGWYGDRGDEVLTEDSSGGTGFLASVCRAWEGATAPAEEAGVRVVHLRSGVVLARHGGALARQLPLFRAGLGGRLGSGRQWLSWITLEDEVAVVVRVLGDATLVGPVNACSPSPVTNAQFTRTLARVLHRPAIARVPRIALRAFLGGELADELVLASQRAVPARLLAAGFSFGLDALEGALASVLAP